MRILFIESEPRQKFASIHEFDVTQHCGDDVLGCIFIEAQVVFDSEFWWVSVGKTKFRVEF